MLVVVGALLICVIPVAVLARLGSTGGPVAGIGPGAARGGPRGGGIEGAITDRLAAQSTALLKGDQAGYLGVAEPAATGLRDELRLRYGSLRALRVASFTQRVAGLRAVDTAQTRWQADVTISVCFVAAPCAPQRVQLSTRWASSAGRVTMTELKDSGRDSNGPRPWEMSTLTARTGARTLVAASRTFANRLPRLQSLAERAAAVADRFSIGTRPDRYIIFFGTSREVESWYGGDVPEWSIGYALPSGPTTLDVAVRLDDIETDFVDDVLRHELTHVATLSGGDTTTAGFFWLVEGVAEYAMESGRPVERYPDLDSVRRYLRDKRWDGRLENVEPRASTPNSQVAAFYGIGYLASRRLGDRYGQERLLKFFRLVIHDGRPVDAASRAAFGAAWSAVSADCVRFVRRAAA